MGHYKLKRAIISALVYADIFDYPLTTDELWQYLIADTSSLKTIRYHDLVSVLHQLKPYVQNAHGFWYLPKRRRLVALRKTRGRESRKKIAIAKKLVTYLAFIPTVTCIGLSGALALHNGDADDDIDLFVITSARSLWITRIFIAMLLQCMGVLRHKNSLHVQDKVCLNMLIDESKLTIPKKNRDLYTAHEIMQMLPLFSREHTYKKFLELNGWIRDFLPHAYTATPKRYKKFKQNFVSTFFQKLIIRFPIFENIARLVQIRYMQQSITTETVTNTIAAFHPFNYRNSVLKEFKKRMHTIDFSSDVVTTSYLLTTEQKSTILISQNSQ